MKPGSAGDQRPSACPLSEVKPAESASDRNICTVSSENVLEVLAEELELRESSLVIVMMWQPIESAWTRLSTSRGLAQISSALRRDGLQDLERLRS